MQMEMTKKNSEGETVDKRGKRRTVVDGVLKNQEVSLKTGEWADLSTIKIEVKEAADLAASTKETS